MQLSLFNSIHERPSTLALPDLFESYFECRKTKRSTGNALAFEMDYESNLVELLSEINDGRYKLGASIAFIVDKPVKREVFAADFRDRIVHHLIIKKLNPLFEKQFIYDSYSCRAGKGTHLAIKRLATFIRRCSQNYAKDCYLLKLDLQGFFMNIDKTILWEKLERFVEEKYSQPDKPLLLNLCKQVIFNDPTKNCFIKGRKSNWSGLPQGKSLFYSKPDCGLPIGNLTSQVFANFYMDSFDHFVKHKLGVKYYGRYVDDFVVVHENKEYLKALIPQLSQFLQLQLQLTLHPKKIYLQHFSKGVKFVGAVILPNRIYVANRTKGNFYAAMEKYNSMAREHKPTSEEVKRFQSSMNSYLGIMKHYKSYKLRKKMLLENLSGWWYNYVYVSGGYSKLVQKCRYGERSPPAERQLQCRFKHRAINTGQPKTVQSRRN
jgi:retron-type reverse transcriptase